MIYRGQIVRFGTWQRLYTHTHMHVHVHTYYTHMHMQHTCTHTHTHMHTHTHTRARTCTHVLCTHAHAAHMHAHKLQIAALCEGLGKESDQLEVVPLCFGYAWYSIPINAHFQYPALVHYAQYGFNIDMFGNTYINTHCTLYTHNGHKHI